MYDCLLQHPMKKRENTCSDVYSNRTITEQTSTISGCYEFNPHIYNIPPTKRKNFKIFLPGWIRLQLYHIIYHINWINQYYKTLSRMVITRTKHCTILRIFKSYRKDTKKKKLYQTCFKYRSSYVWKCLYYYNLYLSRTIL